MDPLNQVMVNEQACCDLKRCEPPSILETLKQREASLKEKLAAVTAAREALEVNPVVTTVLELLAKTR